MVTRVKRTHTRRLRSRILAKAFRPCVAEPLEGRLLLAQSPYWEFPFAIPVTIQAEDFDNGGEGVAYHDTTRENKTRQYREEGVDVEDCLDVGGGYDVAYIDGGEWLEYTVSVPSNGRYDLELRLASGTTGGSFHVEFEGTNVTGSVAIPYTAEWQTWQTVVVPEVRLRSGEQVMRVVFEGEPVIANFNAIRISAHHTPFSGIPAAIPGIVQAEDFDHGANGVAYFDTSVGNFWGQYRATDVDIESALDADGGFNLGWIDVGEWLDYTVQVASAGTYDMAFRVASILDGTSIGVQFGGQDQGTLQVPNTGGWQAWQTIQMPVTLTAGTQVMRLYSPSGWLNLNWVKLSARPSKIRGVKYEDQNGNGVYEMGIESGLASWRIQLSTLDGTTVAGTKTAWDGSYTFTDVPPGTYVVSELMQAGWVQTAPAAGSYTVDLAVGTKVNGKDFGNVRAAEIRGMKFNDLDLDGWHDANEPGLGGWTITLDRNGDDSIDAATTTAADGTYAFTNVIAGRYHVGEVQQTGWVRTVPQWYYDFDVQGGSPYYGIDFGNVLKGGIHGTVYDDVNDDGVRQGGETRLAGWTIMLRQSNGSLLTTTVTDGLGNYSFTDVAPGTYILTEVLQNGWVHTAPATDDQTVNLGSGATLTGVNFGNTVGALLTFDDLPANTVLLTQYLVKGVDFIPDPTRTKAVIASLPFGYPSSSTQVADISTPAGGVEFPIPRVECRLLRTASQVSVYVGLTKPWLHNIPNVVLNAYDANHNIIASAGPVQPSDIFKLTQLKVSSATASIVSFAISCDVANSSPVGIDDLRIITPTTSPDFSLISAATSVNVGPGGSNTATINIIRLNGSAGNVQFSAAGLPSGVTASFTPNPASGNSTVLTLTAASNAPETEYLGKTVTITGTPANGSVGPAPRSTTLQVVVRQNFTVSIAPGTVNMALGKSIPVQLTRLLDFTGTIQLQTMTLPAGVSVTFTPASMTPADFNYSTVGTSMMKLSATPTAPMTDFTRMVIAICEGESSTTTFSIHRIPGVIDSISPNWIEVPNSLKPGTLVTLKGDGFINGSTVQFGASDELAPASYVSADYTELRVSVPRLATSGALTVRTPTGREFKSSSAVTVNSYRNTKGYSFVNPTATGVSWSTAEKLFGHDQMHFFFGLIPDPLAAIFVAIADSVLDDGQCYGVSRTTQQFLHGATVYEYYPPFSGGSTLWGLTGPDAPSDGLWSYIHIQQTAQISAEGIARTKNEAWDHWVGDGVAHVKNDIISALQAGDHPLVSMLQGGTGHTVVAYDLENDPNDPNGYYIRVYDCNRPFVASENTNPALHRSNESDSRIHVTGGHWYFNLGGSTNWDGKMQSLIVTPYGVVPYQPTIPTSPSGIWEMITGSSGSTTQISDANGRFLLNPDGSMNEDPATRLPGALEYGLGLNPNAPPLFLLDSGGQYIQTVKGTGGGTYKTLLLGDGMGVNLRNVPSILGVNDQLMIDTAASSFQFRTGAASKPFLVDLVAKAQPPGGSMPGAAEAGPAATVRTVTISGTSFAGGGDSFGFDAARQRLIYTHQGPATAVTFTFTQPDDTGNVQTFAGQPVVLGAGDKAVFAPSDWAHLSDAAVTMTLTHVNGSPVTQPLLRQSVLPVLELSTQLARPQGADLMVFPGSDDSGAPAVYPLGSISEIHVADGAEAILDKPGGGLIDLPLLSLEGSGKLRLLQGGDKLLRLAGLTLGPNAALNLADNDLVVANGNPVTIGSLIKSGRLIGKTANHTGLAAVLNDKGDGKTRVRSTFAEQDVGLTDVLVKYSWDGDANLDGVVNADDYFMIDSNFIPQAKGYQNGDFNYDGVVNADDYFLIDRAYIGQTGPLAVGEPSSVDAPSTATLVDPGILIVKRPVPKQDRDSLLATLFSSRPVL